MSMSVGKNVVKTDKFEYEAETLIAINEESALFYAEYKIAQYRNSKWKLSEDKETYILPTAKDERDYLFFDRAYWQFRAILASDKNVVFETAGELYDVLRDDPASFEKFYKLAISVNPNLEQKPVEVPKEGEPNPLA